MNKRKIKLTENEFEDHGGYMTAKINKLEEQFALIQKDFQKTNLFQGISIFVSGRTNPTSDELKRIMMENGGIFHHYQRSHTKFVIASNLPDVKIQRNNITRNMIKPEWIVDCLRMNRILDYSNYLLHTNKSTAQQTIPFKKKEISEQESFEMSLSALNYKIQNSGKEESIKTGTAVDKNFLEEFLNNSRLHHISTLGNGFKFYVSDLRKKSNGVFSERDILRTKLKPTLVLPETDVIMHIDMDCFFVSVSLKKHPHLLGKPVAVTHSKGKNESNVSTEEFISMSEIASCSYEARAKGLKNGMFVGQALKLCPELKTIPYEFEDYKKTAYVLYDTVGKYTLDIEAVSCDELYADLKGLLVECKVDVMEFVTVLRQEIFDQTGCTCSVGIGANRLQARLATKEAKPNGQFELLSTVDVKEFMKDKKITELPGVGYSTSHTLDKLNVKTCGQIQEMPLSILQNNFGKKFGETLLSMSKGEDDRQLNFEQNRKSVSVDINYGIRFNDDEEVKTFLKQICEELSKRLNEIEKKGKCITLKIMMRAKNASAISKKFLGHGEADKVSKSVQLGISTSDSIVIFKSAINLLSSLNIPPFDLRGIGCQVSKLDEDNSKPAAGGKLMEMFKKITENQETNKKSVPTSVKTEQILPKKTVSPKKRKTKMLNKTKSNSNLTVESMFSAKKQTSFAINRMKNIDPDVLAELPPDIVEEILRDYEQPDYNEINEDENEVAHCSTSAIDTKEKNKIKPQLNIAENFFKQENWRTTVRMWINEIETPIDSIIENLCNDLSQLVQVRNLDLLYLIMRYLHRVITEDNKENWKTIYCDILYIKLQDEMKKVYGKKLNVPHEFT